MLPAVCATRRRVYLIGLLAVVSARAEVPEVPAGGRVPIVNRAIDYHGGARYDASRVRLRMCSLSGCYEIDSQVDYGVYEFVVEGPAGGLRRRARVTNDDVELWHDGLAIALDDQGRRRTRDWLMARVYFIFLPYRLDDPSVIQQDLGLETWEGRTLHKVKVTFQPGSSSGADDEFVYWFDPSTARLEQFAYSFSGDPGGLRFRRMENFRRIGGILFFDQQNLGFDGPGPGVEAIGPQEVERFETISSVTLRDIEVEPLKRSGGQDASRPSSSRSAAASCMAASTFAP